VGSFGKKLLFAKNAVRVGLPAEFGAGFWAFIAMPSIVCMSGGAAFPLENGKCLDFRQIKVWNCCD
jgi:hypothetical protein